MRQPESIDLIATEVRDQLAAQLRHIERLDAKAGVLLGFAGLFVALSLERSGAWLGAARVAGVISAVFALITFLARDFPVLQVARLRKKYLSADPTSIRLVLLDTHISMLAKARRLTSQKAGRLKVTIGALFTANALAVVGLLVENPF